MQALTEAHKGWNVWAFWEQSLLLSMENMSRWKVRNQHQMKVFERCSEASPAVSSDSTPTGCIRKRLLKAQKGILKKKLLWCLLSETEIHERLRVWTWNSLKNPQSFRLKEIKLCKYENLQHLLHPSVQLFQSICCHDSRRFANEGS